MFLPKYSMRPFRNGSLRSVVDTTQEVKQRDAFRRHVQQTRTTRLRRFRELFAKQRRIAQTSPKSRSRSLQNGQNSREKPQNVAERDCVAVSTDNARVLTDAMEFVTVEFVLRGRQVHFGDALQVARGPRRTWRILSGECCSGLICRSAHLVGVHDPGAHAWSTTAKASQPA
jgi:hypothetical protein